MLASLLLIMAILSFPRSVQAQADNKCPISAASNGRELHKEGNPGDLVYVVCLDLASPYLRFETVMANDVLKVNPHPDERETVAGMTQREPYAIHQPIVAINADYFGAGHGPEGLTVVNGIRLDGPAYGDCDDPKFKDCHDNAFYRASISISRSNNIEISHKSEMEITNKLIQLSRFYTSVGGGPTLVWDGKPIADPCSISQENVTDHNCIDTQQTAVGVSKDGKTLIIVVVESRTGAEMGEILVRYGANTGMKLDGGGSSQLWFNGDLVYHDPKEGQNGRAIADALLIFQEKIPRHDSVITAQSAYPIVAPGEKVELSFELQNRGFLTWQHELPYNIRFINGEHLGLSNYYPLGADVPPGTNVKWSQSIVAPQKPGAYQTTWQLTYEDSAGHVEGIGPKIGYIVTVLPEGTPVSLKDAVRQLIDAAQQQAQESFDEFLSRLVDEINKRIEQETRKITICGQPIFGMLALALIISQRKRMRL